MIAIQRPPEPQAAPQPRPRLSALRRLALLLIGLLLSQLIRLIHRLIVWLDRCVQALEATKDGGKPDGGPNER
jgi:hypothetical protein